MPNTAIGTYLEVFIFSLLRLCNYRDHQELQDIQERRVSEAPMVLLAHEARKEIR